MDPGECSQIVTHSSATTADGQNNKASVQEPSVDTGITAVPSASFFVERIEPPPGLKGSALDAELQAWVEEFSPFPIEHTAWGYLQPKRTPWVLLYAAYRPQAGIPQEVGAGAGHFWLPAFICLCGGRAVKVSTWYFLVEAECLTALHFPAGSPYPDQIISRFGQNLLEKPENAWQLREKIPLKGDSSAIDPGMYRCNSSKLERGGSRAAFDLEYQKKAAAAWKSAGKRRLSGLKTLLAADLRDSVAMSEERRQQRFDTTAWRLLQALAAATVIMLVLQAWHFTRSRELASMEAMVEGRAAQVREVQQREASVQAMRALLRPQASPFDWTMLANSVRPESISFQTVSFDSVRGASIFGQSADIPTVNTYLEALRKTGQFSDIELAEVNTTSEGVRFNLRATLAAALPEFPETNETDTESASGTNMADADAVATPAAESSIQNNGDTQP